MSFDSFGKIDDAHEVNDLIVEAQKLLSKLISITNYDLSRVDTDSYAYDRSGHCAEGALSKMIKCHETLREAQEQCESMIESLGHVSSLL